MKSKLNLLLFLLFFPTIIGCVDSTNSEYQDGDLIFQMSQSAQCDAVCLATESEYSHVGMIYHQKGEVYVLEAVQPVCVTKLDSWIARGRDSHYVVKRLKNSAEILTVSNKKKMKQIAENFLGRDYDSYFMWSDEEIYCSELVWKIYKRACGIEIGKLKKLKEFNLTSPIVKKIMKRRYGNNIPLEEKVISPGDMFDSDLLLTIKN